MKILNGYTFVKKDQRIVLAVLFFAAVLFLHNNVVSLHVASLRAAQEYERATDVRIRKEKFLNTQVKAKQAELRELLEAYETCKDVLFCPQDAHAFLDTLEETCTSSGCTVLAVDNSLPSRTDEVSSTSGDLVIVSRTVGLEVSGTYSNILDLMGGLECQDHKVWFNRLQLSTDRSASGIVHCRVWLTIYVNQDKESAGYEEAPEEN